jgi:hypothetical protein
MSRKYKEYTNEDIIKYTKQVENINQLLGKLNLKQAGGNFANIKRKLQELNIDCSHWQNTKDRQAWSRGKQLKDWSKYAKIESLKPHLIKERGHQCERCKNSSWMNEKIVLEVDHINGDRTDNCLENLILLCCNCHALTPTWRGRKNMAL